MPPETHMKYKDRDMLTRLMVDTSLVDVITDRLREDILNGVYVPGQKLIVRELEEQMQVSQTPIKESLYRLVAEGYVQAFPRRSMVVRRITFEQYEENMEARALLEMYAIPCIVAAMERDTAFVGEMEREYARMCAVLEAPELDYRIWLDSDTNFHKVYMNTLPNAEMNNIYADLKANRFGYFAFLGGTHNPMSLEHLRQDNREHSVILEAIKSRDLNDIVDAIVQHILRPRFNQAIDSEAPGADCTAGKDDEDGDLTPKPSQMYSLPFSTNMLDVALQ